MKPFPRAPTSEKLKSLDPARLLQLFALSPTLPDADYLHWEKLRHLPPPQGMTSLEWWLALKLKRGSSRLIFPRLQAVDGKALTVSRHARIDAAVAGMDRLIGGRVSIPEEVRSESTRDQFIASSLMEEAIHSSLFEGAVSTREAAKELLRSNAAPINNDERMIVNNYRAMLRIREMAGHALTVEAVLELHRILTEGTLKDPAAAGRLQRVDEPRVAVHDNRLHRDVYHPPPAGQLPARMARLVEFANEDDTVAGQYVHPVVRSILLHFQLACDHPFADGNGRTARALFYWSMLRRGYWLTEFLSISRPIYRQRHPYELAYQQVESDEQDATYFVLQQLQVLEEAVAEIFDYVGRKSRARSQLRRKLQGRGDLNHRQLALLDHALRNPDQLYTHESHANSHRVSIITARSDLQGLVARHWLTASRAGKKFVYGVPPDLESRLL